MPDLTNYLWIVWLVFIFVCIIIELLTLEFTFLMISVGSLGGLAANLLDFPWWLQIIVAAVLSVLLILIIRPLLLRVMRRGADPTLSNVAALMGLGGKALAPIGEANGLVKLSNGETWTARLADGLNNVTIDQGERVIVTAIEGSTAVVIPSERNVADA